MSFGAELPLPFAQPFAPPQDLMPGPENFYNVYNVLDATENLLSAGAAIPWAGSVFGDVKIIMGAALIAIGLVITATADLPCFSAQRRVNHIENGHIFIAHGVGNVIAGTLERQVILGTVLWVVRVALRSIIAGKKHKKITFYDWVFQKKLYKCIKHKKKHTFGGSVAEQRETPLIMILYSEFLNNHGTYQFI